MHNIHPVDAVYRDLIKCPGGGRLRPVEAPTMTQGNRQTTAMYEHKAVSDAFVLSKRFTPTKYKNETGINKKAKYIISCDSDSDSAGR